jgi:hypothetical protein
VCGGRTRFVLLQMRQLRQIHVLGRDLSVDNRVHDRRLLDVRVKPGRAPHGAISHRRRHRDRRRAGRRRNICGQLNITSLPTLVET